MKQKELAELLNVSQAMVSRHVKAGMPITDLATAQRWRAENLEPSRTKSARLAPTTAPGPTAASGPPSPSLQDSGAINGIVPAENHLQARTRRESAEADLAELRLGEECRELVRVSVVKDVLSVALATARETLLQIPSRLSAELAADTDPASVQNVLYGEIHRVLTDLAGASGRLLGGSLE